VSHAHYVLATDSCCDLPHALAEELGLTVLEFPFTLDGEQHFDDLGVSMPAAVFYDAMRAGAAPTTAQVPMTSYLRAFTSAAESGTPMLFLSFSSGLSGTFDAALIARDSVLASHPAAQIRVVDTLSAAALQALLVIEAARRRDDGASFEELSAWAESEKRCANGYFTTESLESLRRGGRVSDMAAFAGTMLDVKPILRVNGRGELVVDRAVRGRRKSLRAIAEAFAKRAAATENGTVVVAHGDAAADAAVLEELLRERADIGRIVTVDVGPVIGTHTGPGMVAAAFWGTDRDS